jgi:hypothetical protein
MTHHSSLAMGNGKKTTLFTKQSTTSKSNDFLPSCQYALFNHANALILAEFGKSCQIMEAV